MFVALIISPQLCALPIFHRVFKIVGEINVSSVKLKNGSGW